LLAYQNGLFPMAQSRTSEQIYWYNPEMRGQLSIDSLHIPSRLRKTILQAPYEIKIDTDFKAVINECAKETNGRSETWINQTIIDLFTELHKKGYAHSVECWKDGRLAGGLYGVAIGGAFCGESMFSREKGASKIALVHLCARLKEAGFSILDTQYINKHLEQFGAYEIPREEYIRKLQNTLNDKTDFMLAGIDSFSLVKEYLK
jgi:leucyl/phenylalanyl-tRNA--protein transferase